MSNQEFIRAFEGWHLYRDFHGSATFVEAAITYEKESFFLGVGMNINFECSYHLRLTDKSYDETGMYKFYLAKRMYIQDGLCSVQIDPKEYSIEKGKPFVIRLEREGTNFTGYLNGQALIHYEDKEMKPFQTTGGCGVWIHPENGATFSNFRCAGDEVPLPAETKQQLFENAVEYELDFNNVFGWSVEPHDDAWDVSGKSPLNGKFNQVHLHAFEKDPYVKMAFSAEDVKAEGSFGVFLRHAPHTAYVKVGYDVQKKCWFVEDVPAFYDCESQRFESNEAELIEHQTYNLEVQAYEDDVTVCVDGTEVLKAEGVRHTGFGRIGLFAEKACISLQAFYAKLPNACPVIDGVVKTYVDTDHFAASTEIKETPDGTLVGVCKNIYPKTEEAYKTAVYYSEDKGLTFEEVKPGAAYSGLDTLGAYQSTLRMKNGKYIQVLLKKKTLVQESDDMIHWKDIGQVYSDEDYENINRVKGHIIFHTNSLAEYTNKEGKNRIFLPIAETIKAVDPSTQRIVVKHNTVVYYSDDGGCTWTRSVNTAFDVFTTEGFAVLEDFAESKLVMGSDDILRLYNSRNGTRFVCYMESVDFGVTWKNFNTVRELQCARSSFGVAEDPYNHGIYYMAWVNDKPLYRNASQARTRMSVARSYDGKNWHFVGDAEYMDLRYMDHNDLLHFPLFQVVDPAVTVTKDYVYVTYGVSAFSDRGDREGQLLHVHHEQRPALARFEKSKLQDIPWNATNVCDMSLITDYDKEMILI